MIYHVTTKTAWQLALNSGFYTTPSLQLEGFIHNSTAAQVEGVLNRYYKYQTDLLLLHIDETKLTAPLKYELATSVMEEFPHIFGPINVEAVIKITDIIK
ncbi:MAG: DUF952 domain-containing protein [Ferruginibacter sp.]